jgi:hypothetical protein
VKEAGLFSPLSAFAVCALVVAGGCVGQASVGGGGLPALRGHLCEYHAREPSMLAVSVIRPDYIEEDWPFPSVR